MSDVDYNRRLRWLAKLMILYPDATMKKLQRETLKYYPLHHPEGVKHWMGAGSISSC